MIKKDLLSFLSSQKNLLAFSAGGDSVALFFLLVENNIPFDIAIVDYGLRAQSKEEVAYAFALAKRYNKRCFVQNAPKIEQNFEANARAFRYEFFETLIQEHSYNVLLTAHHLGDRLEWFLMQLTKGAGVVEMLGMQEKEVRENYTLVRPLLDVTKEELVAFLEQKEIKYFEDETNYDEKYKRNYFRKHFATPLLEQYAEGIKRSFIYLQRDKEALLKEVDKKNIEDCFCFESHSLRNDLYHIDIFFKSKRIILSKELKEELLEKKTTIVARKYIVVFYNGFVFITPYLQQNAVMPKKFKERCRVMQIEKLWRFYLYTHPKVFAFLESVFMQKTQCDKK